MNNPESLFVECWKAGIELSVNGEKLHFEASANLPDDLLARLKESKPEMLRFLSCWIETPHGPAKFWGFLGKDRCGVVLREKRQYRTDQGNRCGNGSPTQCSASTSMSTETSSAGCGRRLRLSTKTPTSEPPKPAMSSSPIWKIGGATTFWSMIGNISALPKKTYASRAERREKSGVMKFGGVSRPIVGSAPGGASGV